MIKLQTIKSFWGFGDGLRGGEYYYSQGMRRSMGGIKPNWVMVKSIDSDSLSQLKMIKWFSQRLEGGLNYVYAVDEGGRIYKVQQGLNNWALVRSPADFYGNGLAVDQSERLVYAGSRYLGMYDGTTWVDNWKDFGSDEGNMLRPIELWEDMVFIGNKNKIAGYTGTGDGADWNVDLFRLPNGFVIKDIKAGKNGILIAANKGNVGVLVLWDGYSAGARAPWIYLEGNVFSVAKYKGQWVVSAGNEFYITNGYVIQSLFFPPDSSIQDNAFGPALPAGMVVKDNYLFIARNGGLINRRKGGLWIFDLRTKLWEFCAVSNNCLINVFLGALFVDNAFSFYVGYSTEKPYKSFIGKVVNDIPLKSFYISPILGVGETKKVAEGLIVNLGFDTNYFYAYPNPYWKISAKIFDFKRQLWGYTQTSAQSSDLNKIQIYGSVNYMSCGEVGDEITILEGANAGEIRHIVAINNKGTNQETWTLDSDLPNLTEQSIIVNVSPFKKIGEKIISGRKIKDCYFNIENSFEGKKFLVKLVLELLGDEPSVLEISGVSFIYKDLGIY